MCISNIARMVKLHPIKRLIQTFFRHPIIIIVLLAFIVRIAYIHYDPRPILNIDSYGYFSRAVKLRTGNPLLILFSDERVPAYPLFIAAVAHPTELLVQSTEPIAFRGNQSILFIQMLAGIFTVIFSFSILSLLKVPLYLQLLISSLIATHGALIYWEHTILPETLVTCLLTGYAYLVLRYIKYHHSFIIVLLYLCSILLFLLKPIFIILPFITFLYILISDQKRNNYRLIFLSLISYSLFILCYVQGNKLMHGYGGINHAGEINILGRIMQFNLPLDAGTKTPFFVTKLTQYRQLQKEVMPYRFLEWSDEAIYGKIWLLEDLRIFTKNIVRNNIFVYIYLALPDVIPALTTLDIPNDCYLQQYSVFIRKILYFSQTIRLFHLLLLILFPFYGIIWALTLIKKSVYNLRYAQLFFLAGISMYLTLFAALGSYDSFGRLTTPAIPIMHIVVGVGIKDILSWFKQR